MTKRAWKTRKKQKRSKSRYAALLALVAAVPLLIIALNNQPSDDAGNGLVAEIFYSPFCDCCTGYVKYLRGNDVRVKAYEVNDSGKVKLELGIPRSMWACHTLKIGGYYVEGHVPIEVVYKLLEEKPDIDGIALPGMPAGSPGMGGVKTEPFIIYAVSDGSVSVFAEV
ncbi:MAG: hypothetical protein NXY59_09665 [Aigarchaeota archaeon]|nr:hypothetical protein [Candidatus Pelearchaeum maunauluense]